MNTVVVISLSLPFILYPLPGSFDGPVLLVGLHLMQSFFVVDRFHDNVGVIVKVQCFPPCSSFVSSQFNILHFIFHF